MTTAVVRDVTEATFSVDVLEASRTRPVVVDFWAPWCGPCRQLSPMLEQAAAQWAGEIDVVKLNVDEAPRLSQQFRVQGIPAVKAFSGGRLVAEFVGLQPQANIDRFFEALAPSEADRLVTRAWTLSAAEAEPLLRQALGLDPDHPDAVRGLAHILGGRGEYDEATTLLQRLPGDADAVRMLSEFRLAAGAVDASAVSALRSRAFRGDTAARVELGSALAAQADYRQALEELVAAAQDPATRQDARVAMLEVFRVLGDSHELVREFRPRLAAVLF